MQVLYAKLFHDFVRKYYSLQQTRKPDAAWPFKHCATGASLVEVNGMPCIHYFTSSTSRKAQLEPMML